MLGGSGAGNRALFACLGSLPPMSERRCQILIVGGGTGGAAAAMAAASMGADVILTEETRWIGGQLTAQAVPPDEHPWIEEFGCTRRYRSFREGVRSEYRRMPLTEITRQDPFLNPGTGWVSKLCHEPKVALEVIEGMIPPSVAVLHLYKPKDCLVRGDRVEAVRFLDLETGTEETIWADFVLDATELGDLLALSGTEYRLGAESGAQTGEPNAQDGDPDPNNVQGLTWVFPLGFEAGGEHRIEKPAQYEKWRTWKPDFWPGPLLGFEVLHAHTGERRTLPLFSDDWYALFPYRQIVEPSLFEPGFRPYPVTIVNWPQNDYFEASILDVEPYMPHPMAGASGPLSASRLEDAKQLSLSLLYWLQTEAPRHDGGAGYPEVFLASDSLGSEDGFALYPYIRESRRIEAEFTILEHQIAAYTNPGRDRAPAYADSVGIGAYRIDLHPSTSGANTIDTSTLPFQIPLGSLIPVRMQNLLPACKNLGVTHITNGCYRLHPVEWNIGEAAGALAAFCLLTGLTPSQVRSSRLAEFQALLTDRGVELSWPEGTELRAL